MIPFIQLCFFLLLIISPVSKEINLTAGKYVDFKLSAGTASLCCLFLSCMLGPIFQHSYEHQADI